MDRESSPSKRGVCGFIVGQEGGVDSQLCLGVFVFLFFTFLFFFFDL